MAQLPTAILFDLDDTIVAEGARTAVLSHVAGELAAELAPTLPVELAERLEADFTAFWSDPERHKRARADIPGTRRRITAATFASLDAPHLTVELAHRFADRFTAYRQEIAAFFPTARETIVTLRERGVRLALVTNGAADMQRAKVERFQLAPLFEHIQIEGEHGFGKPETRAYLHAMEALGVQPHETWMVGDNLEWEVAAPQRLGIYAIWHDHLGTGLPPHSPVRPDRIIRRLSELLSS